MLCGRLGRLEGRCYGIYSYSGGIACQTGGCKIAFSTWHLAVGLSGLSAEFPISRDGVVMASHDAAGSKSQKPDEVARLRVLAHDLSNSLEAILQATYLLQQAKLEGDGRRWVELIDSSSQDAVRINREIRKALRTLSAE
jgi:hypothetical protein